MTSRPSWLKASWKSLREKRAEPQSGSERGGKAAALAWPQRDAKSPGAYCAKTDSEGPASVDGAGSQGHCSRWPGLMSTPGTCSKLFLPREGPPIVSLAHSFIHSFVLRTVLKSLLGLGHDAQH